MTGPEFTMFRKLLGFNTREDVALIIGCSVSCVKKWETGERRVPVYAHRLLKRAGRKAPMPDEMPELE